MEDKERQRYILFKIISEGGINERDFISAIWKNIYQLYGDVGASQTGLWLVEYEKDRYGIIRTNLQGVVMVKTTLAMIRRIYEQNCILVVIGTSGTIHALKKKHLAKIGSKS